MQGAAQLGIMNADTAVSLQNVTKEFVQWQRSGQVKDLWKNLTKPEKRVVQALNNVSLTVRKGEFVAYAGANGAGKSTTIKILSGIMQPSRGQVRVLGYDPASKRVDLMKRVGVLFGQRTELWWDHPIAVSFDWKKEVWGIEEKDYRTRLEMIVELLDLSSLMKTFARELSLGQRMRADLGLMLLHNPELIFLDEPTLGLDVLAKRQMINFLKRINKEYQTTIVVTSHDMDDLEEMAERIILLSKGQVAFDGNFSELREVAGGFCQLRLLLANGHVPQIPGTKLLAAERSSVLYEFDANALSVKELFAEIANIDGILDVEIRKAPIEQVIAELYTLWK